MSTIELEPRAEAAQRRTAAYQSLANQQPPVALAAQ